MTDPQETPLSSEEQSLEARLRSMVPVDLTMQTQAGIANRLDLAPGVRPRWATAIAACVLITTAMFVLQHVGKRQPMPSVIQARSASTLPLDVANDDRQFAIATYSNALAQSPASLDAILERQSRQAGIDKVNDSLIPRIGDVSSATP